MFAGPTCGRPMQLSLMNEGDEVDQQLGEQSDRVNGRKGKRPLKQS